MCLVEIGMRPQSFHNMYGEQPGMNDKEKEELRRRSSAMVRRLILGAFGVRNYDYLIRTNYPTEDHLHIDPVSIYCAVVDHEQALILRQEEAMKNEAQMIQQTVQLDPEDRNCHMETIWGRSPTVERRRRALVRKRQKDLQHLRQGRRRQERPSSDEDAILGGGGKHLRGAAWEPE